MDRRQKKYSKTDKRARILILNCMFPPEKSDLGRLCTDLAISLSGEGYDVRMISAGGGEPVARPESRGVEVIRLKAPTRTRSIPAQIWICCKLFLRALFQSRPDVVITTSDPPLFIGFGGILALVKGAKHIYWAQDLYPFSLPAIGHRLPQWLQKILEQLRARILKRCSYIVVPSRCMKQTLHHKTPVHENSLRVIPNWVDMQIMSISEQSELGNVPLKFRIVYTGALTQAHPVRTIVQTARILQHEDKDIEFLFIGCGPKYRLLAKERARLGLDNVRFLPYQTREKTRQILESGDVHLISLRHNMAGLMFPGRIYDAFTIKRPVVFIGPSECEISKLLEDYQAGITIPQGEPDLLAKTIKHLRDNGQDWHLLHRGAAQAGAILTPENAQKAWLELIGCLVNE